MVNCYYLRAPALGENPGNKLEKSQKNKYCKSYERRSVFKNHSMMSVIYFLLSHVGFMNRFLFFAIIKNINETTRQIINACIEFCGPFNPPVNISAPLILPVNKLSLMLLPGFIPPKIPGSVKSQAKCMKMVNHKLRLKTYVAGNMIPDCNAVFITDNHVAFFAFACITAKRITSINSVIVVPSFSSINLKKTPTIKSSATKPAVSEVLNAGITAFIPFTRKIEYRANK